MGNLDLAIIRQLRFLARDGQPPSQMFSALKDRLGGDTHILTILHYFQGAFCLDLSEAKPFVSLSRNDKREIGEEDKAFLDRLVMPAIAKHRREWDVPDA